MGSISRHITPIVINSLGGGHTHTYANTHTDDPHRINCKKPGVCQRVPGLKILQTISILSKVIIMVSLVSEVCMCEGTTRDTISKLCTLTIM